jgi:hypothetical protein
MSDDYGSTLGVGTLHYETDAPTVHAAPSNYEVKFLLRGRKSDHYAVSIESVSGNPVTVVHHRKSDNMGCLTCMSGNQCKHVAALREYIAAHPLPVSA